MAWIESHQSIARHPKTVRFARSLGVSKPEAIGYLHLLWWWSLDYAQDGDLSKFCADEIEAGAEWNGEPGLFIQALKSAGYVDEDECLHDWHDYAGKLLQRRVKNAERMKNTRATNVQSTCETRVKLPTNQPNQPNQPTSVHARAAEEVELKMLMHMNRQYQLKVSDYDELQTLSKLGIGLDFILAGIDQAFAKKPDIKSFAYCSKVIQDLWEKQHARPTASGPYVPSSIPPEVLRAMKEDEELAQRLEPS